MSAMDDKFVNAKNMLLARACACNPIVFTMGTLIRERHDCEYALILRTDPERARRMGLGWAL